MLCLRNDGISSEFWPTAHETSPTAKARAKAMSLKKKIAEMEEINARMTATDGVPAIEQSVIDALRAQQRELARIL